MRQYVLVFSADDKQNVSVCSVFGYNFRYCVFFFSLFQPFGRYENSFALKPAFFTHFYVFPHPRKKKKKRQHFTSSMTAGAPCPSTRITQLSEMNKWMNEGPLSHIVQYVREFKPSMITGVKITSACSNVICLPNDFKSALCPTRRRRWGSEQYLATSWWLCLQRVWGKPCRGWTYAKCAGCVLK